jgi:hypothetical protein
MFLRNQSVLSEKANPAQLTIFINATLAPFFKKEFYHSTAFGMMND